MSQPFIAQIVMFGGNFAIRDWGFCSGGLLPISQNSALFSLIGTIYGGDGRTTFALPEMRGRVPMHFGNGPGLSDRPLGQRGGQQDTVLNQTHLPSHNHAAALNLNVSLMAESGPASEATPAGNMIAAHTSNAFRPDDAGRSDLPMGPSSIKNNGSTVTIGNTGGNQSFTNLPPYTVVNFLMAMQGIFPSRS